jgi:hypothetical protein
MTLIACVHPRGCRTLFADVLVTSRAGSDAFVLPTRPYLAPQRLKHLTLKPVALRRKLIEITPDLVILWSGDYDWAVRLARSARDRFACGSYSETDIVNFLNASHVEGVPSNSGAIVAPLTGRAWSIGDVAKGNAPTFRDYLAAGSGAPTFENVIAEPIHYLTESGRPDIDALHVANTLLESDARTAEPTYSSFGATYEVLYRGEHGFARVDDLLHLFTITEMSEDDDVQRVLLYPHAIRQWYEGNRLYIDSMSHPEAVNQGFASMRFVAPSILDDQPEDEMQAARLPESLAALPKYTCVSREFRRGPAIIRSKQLLSRESASRYFEIVEQNGLLAYACKMQSFIEDARLAWGEIRRRVDLG